jgi:phage-related protein
MIKPLKVILMPEAEEYLSKAEQKIQFKILNSIQKTETGLKGEWFTKLKETNGIYEFRERDSKYFYRILAFWDSEDDKETLILATHGFDKKTNKTPKSEIRRAESIKATYFKNKKRNNDNGTRI